MICRTVAIHAFFRELRTRNISGSGGEGKGTAGGVVREIRRGTGLGEHCTPKTGLGFVL